MGIGTGASVALSAGSSIFGGMSQASAAKKAAQQEAAAAQQGINAQQDTAASVTQNAMPYSSAGKLALSDLMNNLQSGAFGAGEFQGPPQFTAPTLAQVQQTPGYQFTQQEGNKGILEGAAAAGGAISGGTLKSLDQYNSGLANTTYGNAFNQALQTYGAANQAYTQRLQGLQQAYNQYLAPAQMGLEAVGNTNQAQLGAATNIANLLGQQGNAQAAGTMGAANAIGGIIPGVSNSIMSGLALNSMRGGGGGGGGAMDLGGGGGMTDLSSGLPSSSSGQYSLANNPFIGALGAG